MASILIDKKKQFQIQTVQSKLDNYKITLTTLLESRKQLYKNLETTNPNYEKIDKLNNNKILLENTLKEIKNNISKNTNEITKFKYSLKDLPSIRENKHSIETEILMLELKRIDLQKEENQKTYDNAISKAHLDKLQLIDDISIIQNAIVEQNNIISQIQFNAHSFRKDTLSQLHQKKIDKNDINLQTNQINNQHESINLQIIELQKIIQTLEIFKTLLVNETYSTVSDDDINIDNSTIIENNYIEFNIDKNLLLNDKINIIDKIIETNKNRIININNKLNKLKISNNSRINNIIDNYNKTNRTKVISYKDNFKVEKEKKKQLLQVLNTLLFQYDNFENQIIANIKLELTNATNELEIDINRANERLVIMKYRINNDFEIENNCITDEIDIFNMKNKEISKLFNNTNEELQNLNKTIEKENTIGNEIIKLDEEINKYKTMIIQNETNIMLLLQ